MSFELPLCPSAQHCLSLKQVWDRFIRTTTREPLNSSGNLVCFQGISVQKWHTAVLWGWQHPKHMAGRKLSDGDGLSLCWGSPGGWSRRESQSFCFWALFPGSRSQSQGSQTWSVALGQLTTSSCVKINGEFLAMGPPYSHDRWSTKEETNHSQPRKQDQGFVTWINPESATYSEDRRRKTNIIY